MPSSDLRTRKQERAREEIIAAAFALFAERGYADVTVTDIAERAEVGRTTFFRYFGDKQEVVFANEQQWLDNVGRNLRDAPSDEPPSLPQALALLRETIATICRETTRNAEHYLRRERLIADNPELGDRAARKQRRLADLMTEILQAQGASAETAALAPQLALACFATGHRLAAGSPTALGPCVDAAFEHLVKTL